MPNDIKYKPQIWGEPIEGERLSTNGHYTGEQRGTTTQDALVVMEKYHVENAVIRRGTITQDVLNKIEQGSGGGMISFYISRYGTFEAPKGTTWREFIESNRGKQYSTSEAGCEMCETTIFEFDTYDPGMDDVLPSINCIECGAYFQPINGENGRVGLDTEIEAGANYSVTCI